MKTTAKNPFPERSLLEIEMLRQIRLCKLPLPKEEYKFHPTRRWRFDFAYPKLKLALEVEGGAFRSRHRNLKGFEADCCKYNTAALMGWLVIRATGKMVKDGRALNFLEAALKEKAGLQDPQPRTQPPKRLRG